MEDAAILAVCEKETWKRFQDAVVDARVAAHVQKMQQAFDERLQKKVEELMKSYGNEDRGLIGSPTKTESLAAKVMFGKLRSLLILRVSQ